MKRNLLLLLSTLGFITLSTAHASQLVNGTIRHIEKQANGVKLSFHDVSAKQHDRLQAQLKLHHNMQADAANKGEVYAATRISQDDLYGSVDEPFTMTGFDIIDIKNPAQEAHDYTVTTSACFVGRKSGKEFCSESIDYLTLGANGSFKTSRQINSQKTFANAGNYWGVIAVKVRNDQQEIVFETSNATLIDID